MEIACDVLRRNKQKVNISIKNINIQLFKDIKMSDAVDDHDKFVQKYYSSANKYVVTNFLKLFFEHADTNIANAIINAYRISAYSDHIFGIYCSLADKKLRHAANKTVVYIETIIREPHHMEDDKWMGEFCQCVDYYYSLHKVWSNRDSLDKLSKLCDSFDESEDNSEETFMEHVDEMIKCDLKYSVKLLLDNYPIIKRHPRTKKRFWYLVCINYMESSDILFVMFISCIRVKMIKKTDQVSIKKDLMYEIDVDAILASIQNQTFTLQKQQQLVGKLESIMHTIVPSYRCSHSLHKYEKFNQKYVQCLLRVFEHLLDVASEHPQINK